MKRSTTKHTKMNVYFREMEWNGMERNETERNETEHGKYFVETERNETEQV